MLKISSLLLMLLFIRPSWGDVPCKVYGISDSPQRLLCTFPDRHILLSCREGKYFLNDGLVKVAFHLEVESGTVPMVFKTSTLSMTVMMDRPIEAQLQLEKMEVSGTCK